jgi:hypothetical protein
LRVYHCTASHVVSISGSFLQTLVKIRLVKVSGVLTVWINDVAQTPAVVAGSISQTNTIWGDTPFHAGNRHALGMIYGDNVTGTEAGAFTTVADLRRTIPQTALQDWNAGGVSGTNEYDFSSGIAGFSSSAGSIVTGGATIGGKSDALKIEAGGSYAIARSPVSNYTYTETPYLYRISCQVFVPSSNVSLTSAVIVDDVTGARVTTAFTPPTDAWTDYILEFVYNKADDTYIRLGGNDGGTALSVVVTAGDVIYYRDVTLEQIFTDTVYLPEDQSNPGFDVLGNAIANPRGQLLNPRGVAGDSITILEDATLGTMKTWAFIVNYDGEDQTLLDLGTPEITVASDTIATSGITSPTIYVDGVATTTLTTGRHLVVVTTETATDCGPITCSNLIQNGKDVGYDTNPLSASQVSQLYRALRRYL